MSTQPKHPSQHLYQQLITPQQLSVISSNDNLVILDASIPPIAGMALPTHRWPESVIATARQFNINKEFADASNPLSHSMPSQQQFTEQARKLGINQQSQIIVYDHFGLFSSARAWWMFKSMGHNNVAVLNGGLPAWIKVGFDTVPANTERYKMGNFIGSYQRQYFCKQNEVLQAINNNSIQIVDARSAGRFSGLDAEPRAGMRGGHIPQAVNIHYQLLQQDGCLVEKEQLKQYFEKAAVNSEQLILSCGSGVTACILALAADVLGYSNSQVYDGSWSEWGADSTLPIEK